MLTCGGLSCLEWHSFSPLFDFTILVGQKIEENYFLIVDLNRHYNGHYMSYVRIKDKKSVFLASSYRKDGKVKQVQKYLGKAEVLQVDKKRLLRIFDWTWYQKCCFDKNEEIDAYKKRVLLQEFLYQKAKNKTDKLFSHLASLLRDRGEIETLAIPSSELWKAVVLAEEIANAPQNLKGLKEIRENASAISVEIQKILRKPFPTYCCLLD